MTKDSQSTEELKAEIARLTREAADRDWAIKKTNEGIKLLYKELENKNRELEKLDELKSDFVSTVSHELRTPMTIIKESIAQVIDGVAGTVNPDQGKLLTMALGNIERLARIINNLLDISKIEAGKFELHCEEFDLKELVEDAAAGFRLALGKRGLTVQTDFLPGSTVLNADRDKLIQVLTNLIGNAGKFTEKGGITVRVKPQDDLLRCEVADTGIGMAQADIARAFSKFQQFGRKNGAGEKGTGLGLAICKGIIELHRGDIWIESEPGKGAVFVFTVPRNHK